MAERSPSARTAIPPTTLAHEARAERTADVFEGQIAKPLMQGAPSMAQLILAVALDVARKRGFGDLTTGRPQLAVWMRSMSELPSMQGTAPPICSRIQP